jgi:hypothetical protein
MKNLINEKMKTTKITQIFFLKKIPETTFEWQYFERAIGD